MTTVKELSDTLGVSRQRIIRYAKAELGVAAQPRKTLQLTAAQASAVADHFISKNSVHTPKSDAPTDADAAALMQHVAALEQQMHQEREAALRREIDALKDENAFLRAQVEAQAEQLRAALTPWWRRLGRGRQD